MLIVTGDGRGTSGVAVGVTATLVTLRTSIGQIMTAPVERVVVLAEDQTAALRLA